MGVISPECSRLLMLCRDFSPLYGDRLANHLPMTLIAMDRMGADTGALRTMYANYLPKLARIGDAALARDPRACGVGKPSFEGFAAYFSNAIRKSGVQSVLKEWVPLLMPALGASAFHALIRLAYAIDAEDESEIGAALAFWAWEYVPLPLPMLCTDQSLDEIAHSLGEKTRDYVYAPGIIIDKMREITSCPAVSLTALQPMTLSLKEVAAFSLSVYARQEDFTLLHTVTACHAFRLILPYVRDELLATRYLWAAVLMACLTAGPVSDEGPVPERSDASCSWDEIFRLACLSPDPHVIKLCYSAFCEYREYQDPSYLLVAQRKLGR